MDRLSRASRLSIQTGVLAQSGITGLEPLVGFKILAIRQETDPAIVDWIKQQINTAIMDQKYQDFLKNAGVGEINAISTEEELGEMVQSAVKSWDEVLTAAGLK